MKLFAAIAFSALTQFAQAACTTDELDKTIDEAGLFHRKYDEHSWHIGNAEDILYVSVDLDDGDVIWTGVVDRQSRASIAWINKIHREWRYVQLAIDEDTDLVVNFSIPGWSDDCPSDFIKNSAFFLGVLGDLKANLAEFQSASTNPRRRDIVPQRQLLADQEISL